MAQPVRGCALLCRRLAFGGTAIGRAARGGWWERGVGGLEPQDWSEERVRLYWDAMAPAWASTVRRGEDRFREHFNNPAFLAFVGDVRGKALLDAGCGEGYNARILARAGASVTGVDLSPALIALARQAEAQSPLGVRYAVASFADLALLGDKTFDAVVSCVALMDAPELERSLREFVRVLRPGGDLYFSITHPCFTGRGCTWLTEEDGEYRRLVVTRYFDERPWLDEWELAAEDNQRRRAYAVPRFPRTLSTYINTITGCGLRLLRVEEPRPSPEACGQHPWLRRWRDHAALFIYFHARKAEGAA